VFRYLKSAFLVGVDVPPLGRLPVNALGASAFLILGFAQPAFWLLGAALEAGILTTLAFNPRFQKYVDSQSLQLSQEDADQKRAALINILDPQARKRLSALAQKCEQVLNVYTTQQAEGYIVESNEQALKTLQWVYLKLLVARHHLEAPANLATEDVIETKIKELEHDLNDPSESDSLRQSKSATIDILKKRLTNMRRREQSLEEIDSDLTRIENQVDLILENVTIQGKPTTISTDIELASDLLGGSVFGEDESAVSDLERVYAPNKSNTKSPQQETA
jgi:hypothetical protein